MKKFEEKEYIKEIHTEGAYINDTEYSCPVCHIKWDNEEKKSGFKKYKDWLWHCDNCMSDFMEGLMCMYLMNDPISMVKVKQTTGDRLMSVIQEVSK